MSTVDRTVAIDAFPDSPFRHRGRDALACIDVMLATTTLVTAAAQGRRALVGGPAGAWRALAAGFPGAALAGAPEEGPPGSFELTDGPCALARMPDDRRPLLLVSPPGTELIANAAEAGGVLLLSCFRNLSATAAVLAPYRRVALLAAGCREEFSCEDQMAAAWIAGRLMDLGFEAEDRRTADAVRRWNGIAPSLAGWGNAAAQLRREGRPEEVDFVISHVDDLDRPCFFEGNEARLGEPVPEASAAAAARPRERAGRGEGR